MSTEEELLAELEHSLLGGQRRYTNGEVAELTGVPTDRAHRLWVAMGFAGASADERIFTDGDVHALKMLDTLVETGAVSADSEVAVARTLGQSLSRLAEWQIREMRERVTEITEDPATRIRIASEVIPTIEELMLYIWRRQLAAAGGRILATPAQDGARQLKVIGFADIVGYTATTRRLEADELDELLERFEQETTELIAQHHGQIVKKLGDEVLFTVDDPADAAQIAVRLCAEGREERGLPQLRIGLALGQVLARYGDVYGSVVNLAARLTSVARPGTVLIDMQLAAKLAEDERFILTQLRPVSVRGYRHLRPSVLRAATS